MNILTETRRTEVNHDHDDCDFSILDLDDMDDMDDEELQDYYDSLHFCKQWR